MKQSIRHSPELRERAVRLVLNHQGELGTIIDYVTSSPPANPDEPVLVAGDPERMTLAARMAEGIPVDPVTWDGILEAGELVGLPRSEATALVS